MGVRASSAKKAWWLANAIVPTSQGDEPSRSNVKSGAVVLVEQYTSDGRAAAMVLFRGNSCGCTEVEAEMAAPFATISFATEMRGSDFRAAARSQLLLLNSSREPSRGAYHAA